MPSPVDVDAPLLSVVVPAHNVGPWMKDCLASLLRQPIASMELIVVDDHSEDDTLSIALTMRELDDRLTVISATEYGGANARNLGAAMARGKYIIFADGDDIIPDDAYPHLLDSLEKSRSEMAMGRFLKFSIKETWDPSARWGVFDTHVVGTTLSAHPALLRGRACWNKMFLRSFWEAEGITFPEVVRSNDIAPMTRALLKARSIDLLPQVVYLYRARPGTQSMTARAAKSTALRSYLEQEIDCLHLLLDRGEPRLLSEYFSLFLNADGWVHVSNFLDRARGDIDVDRDLGIAATVLQQILALTPADTFARLSAERRRVFRLFSEQRWDVLSHLDAQGKVNTGGGPGAEIAIDQLAEDARALVDYLPLDERKVLLEGLRTRVLRPLIRDANILDDDYLSALGSKVEAYARTYVRQTSGELPPDERLAFELCTAGRATDIPRLGSMVHNVQISTRKVLCDGRRLTIELGIEGDVDNMRIAIVARPRVGSSIVQASLASESGQESALTFTVERRQLPDVGIWDLFVRLSDDDLELERTVQAPLMRQSPDGRLTTFYVHPVAKRGTPLTLIYRRNVLRRGLGALSRRLARRA